jgi:hypothetical protein
MSLYDVAKDALKLAQKSDNAELIEKILSVQSMALDMQEKQFELNKKIDEQAKTISDLKLMKDYIYDGDHQWMVNPKSETVKFCAVCFTRDKFESPLVDTHNGHRYCNQCKSSFK